MGKPWRGWIRAVGLVAEPYDHVLIVYLADRDREGRPVDIEAWETEALRLQAGLFRGATAFPARGAYRVMRRGSGVERSQVALEGTRMVVSFIREEDFGAQSLGAVVAFMRRFKQQAGQRAACLVVDGCLYYL